MATVSATRAVAVGKGALIDVAATPSRTEARRVFQQLIRKPMAVVGGSFGQYGGVWAHDETRKSFGIAGPRIVEDLKLSVPFKSLDGKHPRENAEVAANLRDIVGKLAAAVS